VIILLVMAVLAFALFNTERMQQRMFYSGRGEISDLRWDNPDLQTSGRKAFYEVLWPSFENNPLWGNGFNSYRDVMINAGIITVALPHNDWLKLLHDMGIVGAGLYLFTMLVQIFFLLRIARWSSGNLQLLAYGAASAFVPYMLIMFTDNVILYVQFFGNVHFALIGIVYGAARQNENDIYEGTYQ